jgi:hypothetical protein
MNRIVLLLIIALPFSLSAQIKRLPELSLKNPQDITEYLHENFKLDVDSFCLHTIIFIKFGLSKNGKISNLAFTKGSPQNIKNELRKAILSSNGHWKINQDEIKSLHNRSFLQPYIIDYSFGCNPTTTSLDEVTNRKDIAIKTLAKELNSYQVIEAVTNLLIFEDKNYVLLNCTILPPMRVGNGVY